MYGVTALISIPRNQSVKASDALKHHGGAPLLTEVG